MAKLPEYSAAPVQLTQAELHGGRRAEAQDFVGGEGMVSAGRQVQSAVSSYVTDLGDTEARQAIVSTAQIHAKYARQLDDATLSGADTAPIKEQMMADLSKVGENFQTRKGADELQNKTAASELIFDQQANHIKVSQAWAQARSEGQLLLNSITATLQSDRSYLPVAEKLLTDYVDTRPNIRFDQRVELKDQLTKQANMAAALAEARMNPTETGAALQGGKWNLTPEQRESAIKDTEHYANVLRASEDREEAKAKADQRDREEQARLGYTQRIFSGETGKKIYNDIVRDPNLSSTGIQHMEALLKQHAKDLQGDGEKAAKTSPEVFNALRAAIDQPPGSPGRMVDTEKVWSFYGKGLAKADAEDLEKRITANKSVQGQKWSGAEAEFLRNVRPSLDKSTLLKIDPDGGARMQQFTTFLRDRAEEYKKNPANNPYDLFNPSSKDYVGNYVPRFQSGAQRTQADLAREIDAALSPKGKPVPRKSLTDIFGPSK